jgi:hypothetical protein
LPAVAEKAVTNGPQQSAIKDFNRKGRQGRKEIRR